MPEPNQNNASQDTRNSNTDSHITSDTGHGTHSPVDTVTKTPPDTPTSTISHTRRVPGPVTTYFDEVSYIGPEITDEVRDRASIIYTAAMERGLDKNISKDNVALAAVTIAIKHGDIPIRKREIADVFEIPISEVNRSQTRVAAALNITIKPGSIHPYLDRYCDELGVDETVRETATAFLADLLNESGTGLLNGHSPSKTAAVLIYAAAVANGQKLTQDRVHRFTGTSEFTLRGRYKDIIQNSIDRLPASETVITNTDTVPETRKHFEHMSETPDTDTSTDIETHPLETPGENSPSTGGEDSVTPPREESEAMAFTALTPARQRCVDAFLTELETVDWDAVVDPEYKSGTTFDFRNQVGDTAGHGFGTVTKVLQENQDAIMNRAEERSLAYETEALDGLLDRLDAATNNSSDDSSNKRALDSLKTETNSGNKTGPRTLEDLSNGRQEIIQALLDAFATTPPNQVLTPGQKRPTSSEFRDSIAETAGYSKRMVSKTIDENGAVLFRQAAEHGTDFSNGCHPARIYVDDPLDEFSDLQVTDTGVEFNTSTTGDSDETTTDTRVGDTDYNSTSETRSDDVDPFNFDEIDERDTGTDGSDSTKSLTGALSTEKVFEDIETLRNALPDADIPEHVEETAERLYVAGIDASLPGDIHADNVSRGAITAVIVHENAPVQKEEIADVFDIPLPDLREYQTRVVQCSDTEITPQRIAPFITRYGTALEFGDGLLETAELLYEAVLESRDTPQLDDPFTPAELAAGILYTATIVDDASYTQDEIADAVGVSTHALRNQYKRVLLDAAGELPVDQEAIADADTVPEVQALFKAQSDEGVSNIGEVPPPSESTAPAFQALTPARQRCIDVFLKELETVAWNEITGSEYTTGISYAFRKRVAETAGYASATMMAALEQDLDAILERAEEIELTYTVDDLETLLTSPSGTPRTDSEDAETDATVSEDENTGVPVSESSTPARETQPSKTAPTHTGPGTATSVPWRTIIAGLVIIGFVIAGLRRAANHLRSNE